MNLFNKAYDYYFKKSGDINAKKNKLRALLNLGTGNGVYDITVPNYDRVIKAAEANATVKSAVDFIAEGIASLEWNCTNDRSNSWRVFSDPVQFDTHTLLKNTVSNGLLLIGQAFWRLEGDRDEINLLSSDGVTPILNTNDVLTNWRYKGLVLPKDGVISFINPGRSRYYGHSALIALTPLMEAMNLADVADRSHYLNNGMPGVVIALANLESEPLDKQKQIYSDYLAKFQGSHNTNKVMFREIEDKVEYAPQRNDAQYATVMRMYIERVFNTLKVPLSVYNATASNRATAAVAERLYNTYTLRPIANRIRNVLNTQFVTQMGEPNVQFDFSFREMNEGFSEGALLELHQRQVLNDEQIKQAAGYSE